MSFSELDPPETYDVLLQRVGCQHTPHDASLPVLRHGGHLQRTHRRLVPVDLVHRREALFVQVSLVVVLSGLLDLADAIEDDVELRHLGLLLRRQLREILDKQRVQNRQLLALVDVA